MKSIKGFDYVMVNGQFAIDGGEVTDVRSGKMLRK